MRFRFANLSRLQRRTMSLLGSSLAICAALSFSLQQIQPNHFMLATYVFIALIGASPVVMTMIALARYLAGETDEYLRSRVVDALLWGFGLIMVVDTVLGYLIAYESVSSIHLRSLGVFNLEIFIVSAGIALRVQLWRDR